MAKLYFRYGTVGSAKTLNLLAVAHNYEQQGKRIILIKPKLDTRFGENIVKSRAGLEREADIILDKDSDLFLHIYKVDCILVDEVQFLNASAIDQLREIVDEDDIPVICYGLRTDFKTKLFEGSKRLLEIADSIEEIKTTCSFCNSKAIFNMKFVNGESTIEGQQVDLGCEEKYKPVCSGCYYVELR